MDKRPLALTISVWMLGISFIFFAAYSQLLISIIEDEGRNANGMKVLFYFSCLLMPLVFPIGLGRRWARTTFTTIIAIYAGLVFYTVAIEGGMLGGATYVFTWVSAFYALSLFLPSSNKYFKNGGKPLNKAALEYLEKMKEKESAERAKWNE